MESNTVGTNAEVGNVLLRNVHLAATEDPYRPGDTAVARLMLFNQAHERDALLAARSPQAKQVRLKWDQQCDGTYEQVDRIPILPEGSVPNAPNQKTGAAPYQLQVVGISSEVRPGTTFPLTLTFEHAGRTTVEAKVQATRDGDAPAPAPCQTTSEKPDPEPATPPEPEDARTIAVTGKVEQGPRPDCLLLSEPGRPYILLGGNPDVVHPGANVAVHGRLEPGTPVNCGHGEVLRVLDAIPFS